MFTLDISRTHAGNFTPILFEAPLREKDSFTNQTPKICRDKGVFCRTKVLRRRVVLEDEVKHSAKKHRDIEAYTDPNKYRRNQELTYLVLKGRPQRLEPGSVPIKYLSEIRNPSRVETPHENNLNKSLEEDRILQTSKIVSAVGGMNDYAKDKEKITLNVTIENELPKKPKKGSKDVDEWALLQTDEDMELEKLLQRARECADLHMSAVKPNRPSCLPLHTVLVRWQVEHRRPSYSLKGVLKLLSSHGNLQQIAKAGSHSLYAVFKNASDAKSLVCPDFAGKRLKLSSEGAAPLIVSWLNPHLNQVETLLEVKSVNPPERRFTLMNPEDLISAKDERQRQYAIRRMKAFTQQLAYDPRTFIP